MYDTHQLIIKQAHFYIEAHLLQDISAKEIAGHCAVSHWYFQRIFRKHTGQSVGNYVRNRRLTHAAQQLIQTKEKIIDIAFAHHFSSQEAFTRAFKQMFQLPPAQYRNHFTDFIKKEEIKMSTLKGWFITGSHLDEYDIGVDYHEVHVGKKSGFIEAKEAHTVDGFATMMQSIKADQYVGKRIRLSGYVKSADVKNWTALWMRIDGKDGVFLGFDNMENRPIKGSTPWNQYEIVLNVPITSVSISFGIMLSGAGKAWIDGVQFEEVDASVPVTNILQNETENLPEEPTNLGFEE